MNACYERDTDGDGACPWHPVPGSPTCPECDAPMRLRQSKHGKFYSCPNWPECDVTHGAHPDGRPLGKPATREVREARVRAHAAFDGLWKGGGMKRKDAYSWLQEAMGLTRDEAHIGNFDAAQCERLVELVGRRESRNQVAQEDAGE